MQGLWDLHCHILPGVDDGPASTEEAVPLVKGLRDLGFSHFVATPHVRPPRWEQDRGALMPIRDSLLEAVGDPELTIDVAAENFFDGSAWERFESGELIGYPGGKAALVEFSAEKHGLPLGFLERFFQMRVQGTQVLLAHPERQAQLMGEAETIDKLVAGQTVLLISLTSLGKRDGGAVRRAAMRLVKTGQAIAAASDAHDVTDLRYIERGLKRLQKLVGPEGVDQMLRRFPCSLLGRT